MCLKARCRHSIVAELIGFPSLLFVPAVVIDCRDAEASATFLSTVMIQELLIALIRMDGAALGSRIVSAVMATMEE